MSDQPAYQSAIGEYFRLLDEATVKRPGVDRGGTETFAVERLEKNAPQVQAQSAAIREALEGEVVTGAPDARELASLQLLSAMALDLTVSSSLIAAPTRGLDRSVSKPPALGDLQRMLTLDTKAGMQQLTRPPDRGGSLLPARPKAARMELEKLLLSYVETIPQDTAEISTGIVNNALKLGFGPAQTAVGLAGQEIIAALPVNVSGIVANAAGMLVEAIKKLRAALGSEQEKAIVEQAGGWLKQVGGSKDSVVKLLDRLYETERISKEMQAHIEAVSKPKLLEAERYNEANAALKALVDRSTQTRSTLVKVLRVMSFVQPALMGAVPWGPIGLYSAYTGTLGFIVFTGGDYLDWYRVEWDWIDRVKGLRTVIKQSLVAPAVVANPTNPTNTV